MRWGPGTISQRRPRARAVDDHEDKVKCACTDGENGARPQATERRCGRGGMVGGVCAGWAGWGKGIMLVCAFGVEDRVLEGGEVRHLASLHASVEPDVRARGSCE